MSFYFIDFRKGVIIELWEQDQTIFLPKNVKKASIHDQNASFGVEINRIYFTWSPHQK